MQKTAKNLLERIWRAAHPDDDARGQTLVEYALLLVFIAIVVIVVLTLIGPTVSGVFQSVNDSLP